MSQTVDVDKMLCAFINSIKDPKGGLHTEPELLEKIIGVVGSILDTSGPLGSTAPTGGSMFATTSVPVEQFPTPADKGKGKETETLKEQDGQSEPQWDAGLFHEMLKKLCVVSPKLIQPLIVRL